MRREIYLGLRQKSTCIYHYASRMGGAYIGTIITIKFPRPIMMEGGTGRGSVSRVEPRVTREASFSGHNVTILIACKTARKRNSLDAGGICGS